MRERRIVSVLFADVVGFTAFSERSDPEDVATVQDRFFAEVRTVLERHGGQLEKFIGDAVVAVFGVPRSRDDDASRAVRAGLALHDAVSSLDADLGLPPDTIALRVGVNTGEVAYEPDHERVTGDTVNIAARLEAAADPGSVLVGEGTALAVADEVTLEPVGPLHLKGKTTPIRAWRALEVRPRPSRTAALGRLGAPTIGREAELGSLLEAFTSAATASSRVLLVAPPGVGKSRLVGELSGRVRERVPAPPVWTVRSDAAGGAFDLVVQLLTAALDHAADGSGPRGTDIPAAVGSILTPRLRTTGTGATEAIVEQVVAVLTGDTGRGGGERQARFGAWLSALSALEEGPTALWIVEDVHTVGPDARAFVDAAIARPGRLVVATARPELLTRTPRWCAPEGGTSLVLHLDTLTDGDIRRLVAAHVGDALPRELVSSIVARADGNPLFVEELLRTWLIAGVLTEDGDGFVLDHPPDRITIPTTVRALYEAQLDDLPPAARHLSQRGAVIGRDFSVGALRGMDPDVDTDGLPVLRERALVDGPVAGQIGEGYRFRHAVLRETAYGSLTRSERADLHVRLASWLEARDGDPGEETAATVAHHLTSALQVAPALATELAGVARDAVRRRALSWRLRAARAAITRSGYATALEHADALRALLGDDTGLEAAEAEWVRGAATAALEDLEAGAIALERARDLFEAVLDGELTDTDTARAMDAYARTVERLATVRFDQVEFDRAAAEAARGLTHLGSAPDVVRARVALAEGRAVGGRLGGGSPDDVKDRVRWAAGVAREADDPELQLTAVWALDELGLSEDEEGAATAEESAQAARRLGRWSDYLHARARVLFDTLLDDTGRARDLAAEDLEIATGLGLVAATAWGWYRLVEAEAAGGAWGEARVAAAAAIREADAYAVRRAGVRTWFAIAPIAAAQGDRELLDDLLAWFGPPDPGPPRSAGSEYGRVMLASVGLHVGAAWVSGLPPPSVEDLIVDFGMPSWLLARESIIRDWLDLGRRRDAEAVTARRPATDDRPPLLFASAELIDAWVRLAAEDADGAFAAARRALDASRRCRAPWWTVRAIRVLEAVGRSTAAERDERGRLEAALGVTPTGDR